MPEENEERKREEDRPKAEEPVPGDEARATREVEEESDTDDEESLRRLDEWMMREHDRCANDVEPIDEAAKPLGRIEIDSGEVIDAEAVAELGGASQCGPVNIDSRVERMDARGTARALGIDAALSWLMTELASGRHDSARDHRIK